MKKLITSVDIGERIREIRKAQGVSQETLAGLAGTGPQPYAYGTDAERAQAGAWVVFGRDELPQGEDLVATITPLDAIGCFNGRGGDPISFEFRLPRPVVSYLK